MLTLPAVGLQSEKPSHHPLEAKMRNYHDFLQTLPTFLNPSQKIDANIDATALNTLSPTKPI